MNRYTDTYICNNVKMSYEVFSPDNCENMPLLVFLHGAGERGTTTDNVNRWIRPP